MVSDLRRGYDEGKTFIPTCKHVWVCRRAEIQYSNLLSRWFDALFFFFTLRTVGCQKWSLFLFDVLLTLIGRNWKELKTKHSRTFPVFFTCSLVIPFFSIISIVFGVSLKHVVLVPNMARKWRTSYAVFFFRNVTSPKFYKILMAKKWTV